MTKTRRRRRIEGNGRKTKEMRKKDVISIKEPENQPLIPGIPDEVALDCLARVPYQRHACLRHVCRRWRHLVTNRDLYRHRERIGFAEDLVFIVHNTKKDVLPNSQSEGSLEFLPLSLSPVFGISSYNVKTCEWKREASRIPILANCSATSDGKLVVTGGLCPSTLDPIPDVWVMEVSARRCHKGKSTRIIRSFSAYASDGRRVFVAGGSYGSDTSALNIVEAYDVEADEWVSHPDMIEERKGRINAIFNEGTFWVMSGHINGQGHFETSSEWYDESTGKWTKEEGMCVSENYEGCCFTSSGKLYIIHKGEEGVREFMGRGKGWRKVADAPEPVGSRIFAVEVGRDGNEKVFVSGFHNNRYSAWLFDLKSATWAPVEIPDGFDGFVNSIAAVRV